MTNSTTIWRATVLTLFPEMFPGPLGVSLAGKALASGLWALEARDIRDQATDRHRSVDDTPAGGGPGMVLRADVLAAAIDAAEIAPGRPRLLMSPRGRAGSPDRLRPVRGGRPAGHRGARPGGGLDRRLRAVRRRNRGPRPDRCLRPSAARRDGKGRIRRGGELFGRAIGIPPIYAAAELRGGSNPGHPALGGSCQGRGLAQDRGRGPDPDAAA